eukprot:5494594-Prymnesium_polylepis.2
MDDPTLSQVGVAPTRQPGLESKLHTVAHGLRRVVIVEVLVRLGAPAASVKAQLPPLSARRVRLVTKVAAATAEAIVARACMEPHADPDARLAPRPVAPLVAAVVVA